MSECFAEITVLEDICTLPARMQNVYLQLVSAIDRSFQKLQAIGAAPRQLPETFIEQLVDQMLDESLSQDHLETLVDEELLRQILEDSELKTAS